MHDSAGPVKFAALLILFVACGLLLGNAGSGNSVVFTDYRGEDPGVVHEITVQDLPSPFATRSVDRGPAVVRAT